VFRGFTNTLESYETELRSDIGKGFEVDKILDLIFSVYVPKFHADKLFALLGFFKHYLSSSSDTPLVSTLSKLEASILRFYVVHAVQCNRNDKVVEFFALYGSELLQRSQDWTHWFGAFLFLFRRFCFCSHVMNLHGEMRCRFVLQQFLIRRTRTRIPSFGFFSQRSGIRLCIYLLETSSARFSMLLISFTLILFLVLNWCCDETVVLEFGFWINLAQQYCFVT